MVFNFGPRKGDMQTDTHRPLRRSRSNRMVAGVIAGLANFAGIDVTLARVIYVVGSALSAAFPGVLVYILLWMVIPEGE
jgi:phage shock protein PspC (stress-responsive transcriptional regulator)